METGGNSKDQYYLEKELLAPSGHVAVVLEKFVIGNLIRSFNHWTEVPGDICLRVYDAAETAVKGIFLIDDIQDGSRVRRDRPTAHLVYGLALTINSAVQVLAEATRKAFDLVPSGLGAKILADQLQKIWIGQGTEIYWIDHFICPTEEQYKEMTTQKTGGYIALVVRLLQLFSDDERDYDELLSILGYYSQLRDDYCNLCARELNDRDRFWEDLTEGKFSLPIIHASKTSVGPEVLRILKKRTRDVEVKKYCLSLLEEAGSLQYTRDRLTELEREAREEIARLGNNPLMETTIEQLANWREEKMFT